MSINRHATPFFALATTVVAAVAMIRCGGSSSPTAPGATAVSSVTLNATTIAAGSSGQGTVSLTAAASTGGASISLSSSNPAVATVQTPVTIPAGSSSAAFTITALATGTVTITASLNGSTSQSPTLTVTAPTVALSKILLSTSSVVGGNNVNGTAILTAAAPAGGAVVQLLASADPVTVPASVTVPAGSLSATFIISTSAVGGTMSGTISGSYGGASASAVLSVTQPTVATASFGVRGPTESDTCQLTDSGSTLNCTFDSTTSTAPGHITNWDWSYSVTTMLAQAKTTTGQVVTMPSFSCGMLPPAPLPPGGEPWFYMTITLKIRDDQGNSAEVTDNGVRLLSPQPGVCGY